MWETFPVELFQTLTISNYLDIKKLWSKFFEANPERIFEGVRVEIPVRICEETPKRIPEKIFDRTDGILEQTS